MDSELTGCGKRLLILGSAKLWISVNRLTERNVVKSEIICILNSEVSPSC